MAIQQITLVGEAVPGDIVVPTMTTANYTNVIGDHDNVTDWFTAQASFMTLVDPAANGGTITSIASRRVGSSETLAANPPTTQRPNYDADDADFNGRGSVTHDDGGAGDLLTYSGTFPVSGDFFKVAIVHFAGAPSGTVYPGLSSIGAGNRHLFSASASNFSMRVGPSGTEASASVAFQTGWTCLIGTWNAALKRARISKDFGATWVSAVNASAVVDHTTGQVGQSSNVKWSDQLFGDIDLSDGSETSNALLAAICNYAREFVQP